MLQTIISGLLILAVVWGVIRVLAQFSAAIARLCGGTGDVERHAAAWTEIVKMLAGLLSIAVLALLGWMIWHAQTGHG